MTSPHWFSGFAAWARRQTLADHTLKNYRTWAGVFERFLDGRGIEDLRDVDRAALSAFPGHLMQVPSRRGRPYTAATRALVVAWARKLFGYLVETGQILVDPSAVLKAIKVPRKLPRALLSANQMDRLLAAPDVRTTWGLRDRALLELLYGTGIRYAELAHLAVGDLDLKEKVVWIRQGKGRRDRLLPLGRWATYWLNRYLSESEALRRRQRTDRVFLTPRGNRLDNWVTNERLRGYARQAGITQSISLHTVRHSFATLLLKGGADVRKIQRLLGHEKLTSTQLYTHLDMGDLRRVQERYHPRERRRARRRRGTLKG